MATSKTTAAAAASAPPPPVEPDAPAKEQESPSPEQQEPELRAFEYTWPDVTVYQHIPLTARPARAAVPATEDSPAVAARPATVFAFVEPPDGRWTPTDKPVNQSPDNEPPVAAEAA